MRIANGSKEQSENVHLRRFERRLRLGELIERVFDPFLFAHEHRVVRHALIPRGRVRHPILEPFPLGRIVEVLTPFCLDDPDFLWRPLDDEVGKIIRNRAIRIPVLDE
jgi:hypothetical protein